MDENNAYNPPSSERPDIDAGWQKMEALLDKKKPRAFYISYHRKWLAAVCFILISGLVIWYQSDNEKPEKYLSADNLKNKKGAANRSLINKATEDNGRKTLNPVVAQDNGSPAEKLKNLSDNGKGSIDTAKITNQLREADNPAQYVTKSRKANDFVTDKKMVKNNIRNSSQNKTATDRKVTGKVPANKSGADVAGKSKIHLTAPIQDGQEETTNDESAIEKKDNVIQKNKIVDSADSQKMKARKTDSAMIERKIIPELTVKTDKEKKKNKKSAPFLNIGISPSLFLQDNGYAKNKAVNFLGATDVFISTIFPVSTRFTFQAGLHPFAGIPLQSGKWKNALKNLDERTVRSDINHSVTTVTTQTITGLSSLNLPVTIHFSIIPKLNVYTGLQFSAFFYGGMITQVSTTDSSATGVHNSSVAENANIFKTANRDAIKKTGISGLWGIDYTFRRFTFGLQYLRGYTDITANDFLHADSKNTINDFKISLRTPFRKKK